MLPLTVLQTKIDVASAQRKPVLTVRMMSVLPGTSVTEEVEATARRLGVADCVPLVQSLTEEVFGGAVELSVVTDPEILDDVQIVLAVRASRAVHDLQAKRSEWSRRMFALNHEQSHVFCLSVDPRP